MKNTEKWVNIEYPSDAGLNWLDTEKVPLYIQTDGVIEFHPDAHDCRILVCFANAEAMLTELGEVEGKPVLKDSDVYADVWTNQDLNNISHWLPIILPI